MEYPWRNLGVFFFYNAIINIMGITNFRRFDTFPAYADIQTVTTTPYQVNLNNENDLILVDSASDITINIPEDLTIPVKRSFTVVRSGTGEVFVAPASGVTIYVEPGGQITNSSTPNKVTARRRYSKLTFTKIAANTWLSEGYENYVQATEPANPVAGDLWFF
jgi:hypothetical protein